MIVHIQPGEVLKIKLADKDGKEIDGEFSIAFGEDNLFINTLWEDSEGRKGSIYYLDFSNYENEDS